MLAIRAGTREGVGVGLTDVRFGSQADVCVAKPHVRFTPNSDRNSGRALTVMSASPLKADVCGANRHVCFGPKADISCNHVVAAHVALATEQGGMIPCEFGEGTRRVAC